MVRMPIRIIIFKFPIKFAAENQAAVKVIWDRKRLLSHSTA